MQTEPISKITNEKDKALVLFIWLFTTFIILYNTLSLYSRARLRFFDLVGHQTTNAFIGNKHFFTK